MEPVCSVDSLSIPKGMIGRVLLSRCWYILCTGIEGMVVRCCCFQDVSICGNHVLKYVSCED